MIQIKKKKLSKLKLIVILSCTFVILTAVAIGFTVWSKNRTTPPTPTVLPEILDGEALVNNLAAAYPEVSSSDIQIISVSNKTGSYDLMRSDEGHFVLYYTDINGDKKAYYPGICDDDFAFNYEDLYAVEMGDSFKMIPKLTYLCVALEIPYFSERIALSENEAERDEQLRAYGLTQEEVQTVAFSYVDKSGNEGAHVIAIGSNSVTGNGYYFMVDGRNYVYMTGHNYYSYALAGFASFIKPLLVAEGLADDKGFEPYLTTNYYQWINEMHKEEGSSVEEDSRVIVFADKIEPSGAKDTEDGYIYDGYELREFDLSKYSGDEEYTRLINALLGKQIGKYYDPTDALSNPLEQIIFTLTYRTRTIDFSGEKKSYNYKYVITAIESIITDEREIIEEGARVADADLLKITFDLEIDGVRVSASPSHAVIDISEDIFADIEPALRAASIGVLDEAIVCEIEYTEDNASKSVVSYIIEEIISINAQNGANETKVKEDSIVSYRVRLVINGVPTDETVTATLDLGKATSESDQPMRLALIGRSVSRELSIPVEGKTGYSEHLYNFETYNIARIDYYITKELITAFRFKNESERDPYYGESLYENLLENKYSLYGLNANTCEMVVKILGGISKDSTSGASEGLFGDETLAVGLTPEVMKKYDLYDYTVYFELPRGIYSYIVEGSGHIVPGDTSSGEDVVDYDSYDKLGFTLYISKEQPGGIRYVGSDLYDIVTRVDADSFDFLEESFADFWARRNIILINVGYIENLELELNMSDIYGSYNFDVSYDNKDNMIVSVTPGEVTSGSKLVDYINEKNRESVSLTELYNHYVGKGQSVYIGTDTMGVTYFKETVLGIFYTTYQDVLTDEEQASAMTEERMLMRIKLDTSTESYKYVYEFYRVDDRRVMVRIYREDSKGVMKGESASDFYISTLGFKKIVGNFMATLNAEEFEREIGYPDDLEK